MHGAGASTNLAPHAGAYRFCAVVALAVADRVLEQVGELSLWCKRQMRAGSARAHALEPRSLTLLSNVTVQSSITQQL